MKSERAKAYIRSNVNTVYNVWCEDKPFTAISKGRAFKAVQLAESDAEVRCRERAVRAAIYSCRKMYGHNMCSYTLLSCKKQECAYVKDFITHYDNQSLTEKR